VENLIALRLRKYIAEQRITLKKFAGVLEISPSSLTNYLLGKSDIQKLFVALNTKANINLNWLVTGKGNSTTDKSGYFLDFDLLPDSLTLEQAVAFEFYRRKSNVYYNSLPKQFKNILQKISYDLEAKSFSEDVVVVVDDYDDYEED